jgi:hypothetical protein
MGRIKKAPRERGSLTTAASAAAVAVFAALAARFRGALAVFGEIAPTALMAAALMAAMAMLTAFPAGFGCPLTVARKTAFVGWHALPALAAGFGGALRVVLEVSAAGLTAFAGDFALLLLVHRCEAAIRSTGLMTISHYNESSVKVSLPADKT